MIEALRYEFSMMTWKNIFILFGMIALMCAIWIFLPRSRAKYRQKRANLELQYDGETSGQVLNIRELYRPAGEKGIIRVTGHEIRYEMDINGQIFENLAFIPKNPDPGINRQLKGMMDGEREIVVKYQKANFSKNTLKLIY